MIASSHDLQKRRYSLKSASERGRTESGAGATRRRLACRWRLSSSWAHIGHPTAGLVRSAFGVEGEEASEDFVTDGVRLAVAVGLFPSTPGGLIDFVVE